MSLRLIDTHAHLDMIDDIDIALREASAAGVIAVVAPGYTYDSNQRVLEISQRHHNFVYAALGLHPWQMAFMQPQEVDRVLHQIEDNISEATAIGEIGLHYDERIDALASRDRQRAVLKELLGLANKYNKPAIIHTENSWADAVKLAIEGQANKVVFHDYAGPSPLLHDMATQGYFVSVSPGVAYDVERRRVVCEGSLSKLLLETDTPLEYGTESKYAARPKDVGRCVPIIAAMKRLEETTVAEQTTRNAIEFFSLTVHY